MAIFADGGGSGSSVGSGLSRAFGNIASAARSSGTRTASRSTTRKPVTPTRGYTPQRSVSRQPTYNPPRVSRPAVGSTSKGTVAPSVPAPARPPMTLDQWLANDTTFKSSKDAYSRALQDYMTQDTAERSKYDNEYNSSLEKMAQDKTVNQQALNDDYAGRGLLNSGLYANALNEFQNKYSTQQADLERARSAYFGDLNVDKSNFQNQQQLELQKAQQAAAARRTATLGL